MLRVFGPFELSVERRVLRRGAEGVPLQPKVFDLLVILTGAPGRLFARAELEALLWPDIRVSESSLHQAIRRLRRALGDDPAAPTFVEAVSRRGWRFVGAVREVAPRSLAGRDALLADLAARSAVPGCRLALHGPPGIGKSAVALELGARVVPLRGCTEPADLERRLAGVLGVSLEEPNTLRAAVAHVDDLVVFDDADGLAEVLVPLLHDLGAARLRVVATARTRVVGAQTLPVPPLPPDVARAILGASGPDVDALVERLEGNALALTLAAGRLRLLSPAALGRRLDEAWSTLSAGDGRSLEATVRESLVLLRDADRALLAACACFPGPFDAEVVATLAEDQGLDGLDRLVDASLVRRVGERFAVEPAVRPFVGPTPNQVRPWGEAVARRFVGLVPRALRFEASALQALRAELETLVAAHRAGGDVAVPLALACRYGGPWALADQVLASASGGDAQAALRAEFALRRGREAEGTALLAAPLDDAMAEVHRKLLLARVAVARGRPDDALRDAAAAAEEADAAGAPCLAALCLDAVGSAHGAAGDLASGVRAYDAALARVAHDEGVLVRVVVAQNGAAILGRAGRDEEALARLEVAAAAVANVPLPHLRTVVHGNRAMALLACGRVDAAEPLLRASVVEARALGDLAAVGRLVTDLALVAILRANGAEADRLLDEAAAATPRPSPGQRVAWAVRRSWAALIRGDRAAASVLAAAARALDPDAFRDVERHADRLPRA